MTALPFFNGAHSAPYKLNDKFLKAYKSEYEGQDWSKDESTQANLRKETTRVLDIANAYIALVTKNNESILEVLRNNYAHIDPDDIDVIRQLIVDYTRLKTERDEAGILKTPIEIYKYVGEISFMRPQFIERIKEKFNSKKKKMDELIL